MGNLRPRRRGGAAAHDRGYKLLFSDPTLLEELLRGFLPGDWTDRLDFTTLEKVGNSFVSADLRERHSDVIWRLRLRGDGEGWIYLYLLLEFQSTSDRFMALRLLTYIGLLLEEIVRKEKLKPQDRLPAVLPLVLYNGDRRWRAPLRLESLFVPVPAPLRRHLPRLTYHLFDERRLDLNRPELQENRTAALFRFETSEAPAMPRRYRDLKGLVKPGESELDRTIQTWLVSVIQRAYPDGIIPAGMNPEEASMLEETLAKYFEGARQEGLQEGLKEGRQEGRREGRREGLQKGRREGQVQSLRKVLLQQMTLRFGRLPRTVRSQVEQITSAQELEKLARKIVTAKSLEQMGLG